MNKSPYLSDHIAYSAPKISLKVEEIENSADYMHKLLMEKIHTVLRHFPAQGETLLDLGCGNGNILVYFIKNMSAKKYFGVDYSLQYIEYAQKNMPPELPVKFHLGDITQRVQSIPLVDCAYSFSTLYYLPDFSAFARNLTTILKPGGTAILDLGNSRSLNVYCCRYYEKEDGWAVTTCSTIEKQLKTLEAAGLTILERRSFQLLPLWAQKPRRLRFFLSPLWKRVLQKTVSGKMLDEWVCGLPFFRPFAFRHLVVLKKSCQQEYPHAIC